MKKCIAWLIASLLALALPLQALAAGDDFDFDAVKITLVIVDCADEGGYSLSATGAETTRVWSVGPDFNIKIFPSVYRNGVEQTPVWRTGQGHDSEPLSQVMGGTCWQGENYPNGVPTYDGMVLYAHMNDGAVSAEPETVTVIYRIVDCYNVGGYSLSWGGPVADTKRVEMKAGSYIKSFPAIQRGGKLQQPVWRAGLGEESQQYSKLVGPNSCVDYGKFPKGIPAVDGMVVYAHMHDEAFAPSPAASPEASPEASPAVSPEASPEVSPEASPEVSPEASPEVSPEASPEVSPEASPEVSPEASPAVSPEANPEVSPEASPEVSPEASPEVSPEASPEVNPVVTFQQSAAPIIDALEEKAAQGPANGSVQPTAQPQGTTAPQRDRETGTTADDEQNNVLVAAKPAGGNDDNTGLGNEQKQVVTIEEEQTPRSAISTGLSTEMRPQPARMALVNLIALAAAAMLCLVSLLSKGRGKRTAIMALILAAAAACFFLTQPLTANLKAADGWTPLMIAALTAAAVLLFARDKRMQNA